MSGLPRSGTSMMMKMLDAAGLPIVTDAIRTADIDNPKGYYELERVKDLEKETDKSYIRDARGKVLKVISFLIKDLPDDNQYRIIFMRRDLNEVIASQNKMIAHRKGRHRRQDDDRGLHEPPGQRSHHVAQEAEHGDGRDSLRYDGRRPERSRAAGQRVSGRKARRSEDDRRGRRQAVPEPQGRYGLISVTAPAQAQARLRGDKRHFEKPKSDAAKGHRKA
jgi:hypothetical protein